MSFMNCYNLDGGVVAKTAMPATAVDVAKLDLLQHGSAAVARLLQAAGLPTEQPPRHNHRRPKAPTQPVAGASHTISSTGWRRNLGCRCIGSGRACGLPERVACTQSLLRTARTRPMR